MSNFISSFIFVLISSTRVFQPLARSGSSGRVVESPSFISSAFNPVSAIFSNSSSSVFFLNTL